MSNKREKVFIIDDDEDVLLTAKMILRSHYTILTESSPKKLIKIIKEESPDIILLDMNFKTGATSGNEGLFWLREIKKVNPDIEIIMNTAYGDVKIAVESMKEGAADFIVKPWEKENLLATVNKAMELIRSRKKINRLEQTKKIMSDDMEMQVGELVGQSAAMQTVYDTIRKVAKTNANVLILGENGTGKELVARAIHKLSNRKDENFVKVDLGALTESLFESELFGHVKGSFTDAKEDRMGRFEMANEGTLFLDEIGNTTINQQTKLLSVLQNREVIKIGTNKPIPIDIRLISATNKPIEQMAEEETFRQDLLYRIKTIEIVLPPLRERSGDIEILAKHFSGIYGRKYDKSVTITKEAIAKLNQYDWPGNIRELQHAVERAVIMSNNEQLEADDFLITKKSSPDNTLKSLNVEEIEKSAILQAISKNNGNYTKAAKELGMGRSTLYRKMDKYNIQK